MPTGCLAVLLVAITFVATAFFLALGIIKQTDAFKLAFSRAEREPGSDCRAWVTNQSQEDYFR